MTVRKLLDLQLCSVYAITILVLVSTANGQTGLCKDGTKCVLLKDCPGLHAAISENPNNRHLKETIANLRCVTDINQHQIVLCCPTYYRIARFPDKTSLLPNSSVCGIQNNDRIVGGQATELDEHPWMALLHYKKPKGSGFYCGGVLISSRYVLTAAHCVKGADLPKTWTLTDVRLGEYKLSSNPDCVNDDCAEPVVNVPIEEIIPHPQYEASNTSQQYDIALLRLKDEVKFNYFVKPICLPLSSELRETSYDSYTMEVAGWGKTENRSSSDVKLKVRLPIVNNAECAEIYNIVNRIITDRQMCAGGLDGSDSCRGDSGGPLMGQVKNSWFVLGVVSYGPSPCGTQGWPGVYTRVTSYIDWILDNIQP